MNIIVKQFVDFVTSAACPHHDKEKVKQAIQKKFQLVKDRSVFYGNFFAVRFSFTKTKAFSNTVLSLSALQKFDTRPFFVVLVSGIEYNTVLLANSTFLHKISHSSQQLSLTNIKGSFNGSDIMRYYHGLENNAKNVEKLFAYHQRVTWKENLQRLVETTAFSTLNKVLNERVQKCSNAIAAASKIENVNIRGRLIEALITSNDEDRKMLMEYLEKGAGSCPVYDTKNDVSDYRYTGTDAEIYIDIKTKVLSLKSVPKAYNIDKFLEIMSEERSVFCFYVIGIDTCGITNTILCSVYHRDLLEKAIKQFHCAGRNSRGVIQFEGDVLDKMLKDTAFKNIIDKAKARKFIDFLLE